mmetsp:Transcript_28848/g.89935  ORF Transcript_28848/g.89935 Transcript_28848/m.89935 type:complete len:220 (+) Transcript_28848:336-995(+)
MPSRCCARPAALAACLQAQRAPESRSSSCDARRAARSRRIAASLRPKRPAAAAASPAARRLADRWLRLQQWRLAAQRRRWQLWARKDILHSARVRPVRQQLRHQPVEVQLQGEAARGAADPAAPAHAEHRGVARRREPAAGSGEGDRGDRSCDLHRERLQHVRRGAVRVTLPRLYRLSLPRGLPRLPPRDRGHAQGPPPRLQVAALQLGALGRSCPVER